MGKFVCDNGRNFLEINIDGIIIKGLNNWEAVSICSKLNLDKVKELKLNYVFEDKSYNKEEIIKIIERFKEK
jgi:hypothetical protein